jgi:hypothetical protein
MSSKCMPKKIGSWCRLIEVKYILCATVREMSLRVRRTGREIEFRSRCLDDGRKSKSNFNIYNLLSQLQHIYPHICGFCVRNGHY